MATQPNRSQPATRPSKRPAVATPRGQGQLTAAAERELDRRLKLVEAGGPTFPAEQVWAEVDAIIGQNRLP